MRLQLALVSMLFVATTTAQAFPVGSHDVAWTNAAAPSLAGDGTPILTARLYYPATTSGVDMPVLPKAGGWPAVVFLHGMGLQGNDYALLAADYAQHGIIAVMLNTAPWAYQDLAIDGRGMFAAIGVANAVGSPSLLMIDAFDMNHIGIAGHSMGGGVVGLVLADNPGYCCGLALAPVWPGPPATKVEVPFGIIAGHGDAVTTWFVFSYPYFLDVAPKRGLKFLYVLDATCDHMNVAGLTTWPSGVYEASRDVGIGFFDRFLGANATGLEHCVGPAAMSQPRLFYFEKQVIEPQVWSSAPLFLGTNVRISVLAGGGLSGALAALGMGSGVQTVIGTLLLDPGTLFTLAQDEADRYGEIDTWVSVPNVPQLIGQPFALQAAGSTPASALQLGSALQLFVQ